MSAARRFRPRVFELEPVELHVALRRLRSHAVPILLDSARGEPCRASVLGIDPLPTNSPTTLAGWRGLARTLRAERGDDVPGPFRGGFLGALSYDLGVEGERPVRCAPEPFGFAPIVGGLYVDFLVRDETARRTWLVLGDEPGDERASVAERKARIESELAREAERSTLRSGALVRHVSSAEHRARIERCRAYIARGDIYQANLAHRFTCAVEGSPFDWYERLREVNPAPYMGFASWGSGALLSASPELLLEFDGRTAVTRPIKGTSPRFADAREDQLSRERLLASEKDRAELAMIVDLERNDLGRVARAGGVRVERFPHLQSFARVHHLMADVIAEVEPATDAWTLLASLFPGGSISGAPKLRAMEVIAELEGEGRGFFCGSLGCIDTRGHARFNVLIRTLLWRELDASSRRGELSFRVGGGITWSSEPEAEERETLDKAAGLIDALGGTGVVASEGSGR